MSSSRWPTASGGSAISCSPSIAMPSRLVASTTTPGHGAFDLGNKRGHRTKDVLAIVEHQQQSFLGQHLDERVFQR